MLNKFLADHLKISNVSFEYVVGFCKPLFIEEIPVCLTDATRPVSKHPRHAVLRATLFTFWRSLQLILKLWVLCVALNFVLKCDIHVWYINRVLHSCVCIIEFIELIEKQR